MKALSTHLKSTLLVFFLFIAGRSYAQSPCNVILKNELDCQIKFEFGIDCPGKLTSHYTRIVSPGSWGSPSQETFSGISNHFCNLCPGAAISDTSCLKIRICDLPAYDGFIKCCDPGCESAPCFSDNCCGEAYVECDANGNLVIGLRKPIGCP